MNSNINFKVISTIDISYSLFVNQWCFSNDLTAKNTEKIVNTAPIKNGAPGK